MEVDCGEPPPQLRRLENQAVYYAKLKSIPNHPANSIIDLHWTNAYGKYNKNNQPFIDKIVDLKLPQELEEINKHTPSQIPPWTHLQIPTDTSLQNMGSKRDDPTTMLTHAAALVLSYA